MVNLRICDNGSVEDELSLAWWRRRQQCLLFKLVFIDQKTRRVLLATTESLFDQESSTNQYSRYEFERLFSSRNCERFVADSVPSLFSFLFQPNASTRSLDQSSVSQKTTVWKREVWTRNQKTMSSLLTVSPLLFSFFYRKTKTPQKNPHLVKKRIACKNGTLFDTVK